MPCVLFLPFLMPYCLFPAYCRLPTFLFCPPPFPIVVCLCFPFALSCPACVSFCLAFASPCPRLCLLSLKFSLANIVTRSRLRNPLLLVAKRSQAVRALASTAERRALMADTRKIVYNQAIFVLIHILIQNCVTRNTKFDQSDFDSEFDSAILGNRHGNK